MVREGTDAGVPTEVLEWIEAADETVGSGAALEARYRGYRRQQATALLAILPRDAIRPLHREALTWATDGGYRHDPREPLETLLVYCSHLLPLPPFEVWREDLRRNPLAHADASIEPAGPGARPLQPVTLAARTLEREGDTWDAGLRVFAEDDVWRGYIVFRSRVGDRRARTARVFREEGPEAVRERFMEMTPATLAAFLRSSLT